MSAGLACTFAFLSAVFTDAMAQQSEQSVEPITVAVASNFIRPAKALASEFEGAGNTSPVFIFGSTGKHVAQIEQGLAVDILLAADKARPQYLADKGQAINDQRHTYAVGRLVFWSPGRSLTGKSLGDVLTPENVLIEGTSVEGSAKKTASVLAMANPRLAPYGLAAQQVLTSLGIEQTHRRKYVMGENIAQTFQFVASGNAEAGFVAASQVQELPADEYLLVPQQFHNAIEQQMVLLTNKKQAKAFYQFILSPKGMEIIRKHGYDTR